LEGQQLAFDTEREAKQAACANIGLLADVPRRDDFC
jgi:hypothetical protein